MNRTKDPCPQLHSCQEIFHLGILNFGETALRMFPQILISGSTNTSRHQVQVQVLINLTDHLVTVISPWIPAGPCISQIRGLVSLQGFNHIRSSEIQEVRWIWT